MVWGWAGKSVPAYDWEAGLFIFICIRRRQLLGFMGFVRAPKAEKEKVCPHWGSTGRRQCPSVLGSGKGEQGDLRHSNPHRPSEPDNQSILGAQEGGFCKACSVRRLNTGGTPSGEWNQLNLETESGPFKAHRETWLGLDRHESGPVLADVDIHT